MPVTARFPILALTCAALWPLPAAAQEVVDLGASARPDGWAVVETGMDFDALVEAVRGAAKTGGLAVVTQAGPTGAAARRGIEIPGNRVLGLFNNDFAVRILRLSTPAMIEAPVRVYVTEDADGTATLGYVRPSVVFAEYVADSADPAAFRAVLAELDAAFAAVARAVE